MIRNHSPKFLTAALILLFANAIPVGGKPNIVMLFINDWAWNGSSVPMDDAMPNSKIPVAQMPNLEKLVREGKKFRNAYSGAPQCSRSRVYLQTGKSAPRSGYTVFLGKTKVPYYDTRNQYQKLPMVPTISDSTIDDDAVTIPEALKPHGYVSAHIGKWHTGGDPGDEGYGVHDGDTNNDPGNTLKARLKEGEEKLRRLPEQHEKLFKEMMRYLEEVDARFPKMNPDYDAKFYQHTREYEQRMLWGPFEGRRSLEEAELPAE